MPQAILISPRWGFSYFQKLRMANYQLQIFNLQEIAICNSHLISLISRTVSPITGLSIYTIDNFTKLSLIIQNLCQQNQPTPTPTVSASSSPV